MLRIGDNQLAFGAAACIQLIDEQVLVGLVVNHNTAVAIQYLDIAVTGTHNQTVEFHITALNHHVRNLDAVAGGVIYHGEFNRLPQNQSFSGAAAR